jgi:type IV secretion system protein VirB10
MGPIIIREEVAVPAPAAAEKKPAQPAPSAVRTAMRRQWSQGPVPVVLDGGPPRSGAQPVSLPGPAPLSAPALEPMHSLLPATATAPRPDYEGPRRLSTGAVDNSRILAADRTITGILETGINSQVGAATGGTVIVQTARDVFGYHGRNILLPKGSRLICDYAPPADVGSSRLALTCRRVLLGGHRAEIRELASMLGDPQGRAGSTGRIDRRFWERYGTAFILTGLSTAVRMGSTLTQSTTREPSPSQQSTEMTSAELSNRLGEISASVLEQSLSLKPIITIPQGTRVQIRPDTDWYIKES